MGKWKVYVLIKDNTPIYVGCTSNIRLRINNHKSKGAAKPAKIFDRYLIIKEYDTKAEALNAENAIIRFNSMFYPDSYLNGRFVDLFDYRKTIQ